MTDVTVNADLIHDTITWLRCPEHGDHCAGERCCCDDRHDLAPAVIEGLEAALPPDAPEHDPHLLDRLAWMLNASDGPEPWTRQCVADLLDELQDDEGYEVVRSDGKPWPERLRFVRAQHAEALDRIAELEGENERLLEAIRLTQEYAQLPAIAGWSWYDAYRAHRPEDAGRLHAEWLEHRDAESGDAARRPVPEDVAELVEWLDGMLTWRGDALSDLRMRRYRAIRDALVARQPADPAPLPTVDEVLATFGKNLDGVYLFNGWLIGDTSTEKVVRATLSAIETLRPSAKPVIDWDAVDQYLRTNGVTLTKWSAIRALRALGFDVQDGES